MDYETLREKVKEELIKEGECTCETCVDFYSNQESLKYPDLYKEYNGGE